MQLKIITSEDLQGKGVLGMPDVPGYSSQEMQRRLEEIDREVLVPTFNENVQTLLSEAAAEEIGATPPQGVIPEPLPEAGAPTKLGAVLRGIVSFVKSFVEGFAFSKDETINKINEKVVEIGAGDMAAVNYDPLHVKAQVQFKTDSQLNTINKTIAAAINEVNEKAISEYVHSYTPATNVHELTGTGDNIKFTATADYTYGDTFTVNGLAVSAKAQSGEELDDGFFVSGAVVTCFKDGDKLNFKQGGALNFKIIGVSAEGDLPTMAKENTLAVISEDAIGDTFFQANAPTTAINGDIWFESGYERTAQEFSAIKKGRLMVSPRRAYQYIDSVWVKKPAKIRKNNAWDSVRLYVYRNGNIAGMPGLGNEGGSIPWGNYGSYILISNNAIGETFKTPYYDFTVYNTVRLKLVRVSGSGDWNFWYGIDSAPHLWNKSGDITLNISGYTGNHRFEFTFATLGSSQYHFREIEFI